MPRQDRVYAIVTIILSILPVAVWLYYDATFPGTDAGDYLVATHNIYRKFVYEGIVSGLEEWFTHRGWRPILFPQLGVPFLLLSGGNLLAGKAIFILTTLGLVSFLLFKISRQCVSQREASVITIFLTSSPAIFGYSVQYLSEISLCLFLLLSFLWMLRLDPLDRTSTIALGFSVGLALLVRPIEGALYLIPMGVCYAASLERSYHLGARFWISTLVMFLLLGLYLAQPIWGDVVPFGGTAVAFSTVLTGTQVFLFRKRVDRRNLSICFGLIFLLCFYFFGPYMRSTYEWIYDTTFGELAKNTGNRKDGSVLKSLKFIMTTHGSYPLAGILVISLGLMVRNRFQAFKQVQLPSLAILSSFLFPILIGLTTFNGDPRYYTPGFLLLTLFALILLILSSGSLRRYVPFAMMLPISLNLINCYQKTFDKNLFHYNDLWIPHVVIENSAKTLVKEIESWKLFHDPNSLILYIPGNHPHFSLPSDPWRANLALRQDYPLSRVQFMMPNAGIDVNEVWPLNRLHRFLETRPILILFGPIKPSAGPIKNPFNNGNELGTALLQSHEEGDFGRLGLRAIRSINIEQAAISYSKDLFDYILLEKL
jgi:hypothetical protein